ncbi:Mu transposase C-terminal domain-containing protein [Brevundimonas sp. PAMC22021]|uniref:Mu transposase C-terminal domain-containing protein n=1 Tax=Brevundimonas sp. PAMC22021 TaxID=2861285 RepID=UPI001C62E1C4|nr:Mu transposase C-terminal domain-containing protein [Brevundimonas sp. PAMC22021]QYF87279.1 Mu transposase C-terminal domain-containing protein [Brevundimonas sp. PAMC22021]
MSLMRLGIGDVWEIDGERHYLDRILEGGFLVLRAFETGQPYQRLLDTGEVTSPTRQWLEDEFAAGTAKKIDVVPASKAQFAREADVELIIETDPRAIVRQIVLKSLDRMGDFSRSDDSLLRALAIIWESKPRQLLHHRPPSPSTVRRWLRQRGAANNRPLRAMVSASGRVSRRNRLPASVRRRMHEAAAAYWSNLRLSVGDAYDDLVDRLRRINGEIENRAGVSVPVPSRETFRKHLRSLECFETVAARYGVKEANKRFKATGKGLTAHRPLLLATIDHTPADVHIVMEADEWRYVGRPFLTLIVDVHSRCILGWVLSFEPPSLYSVIECIRRANRPKPRMRDLFPDCPELADIYGKCDEVVVDNGLEFIGPSFESGMTDLGVSIRWAPIKSPTYKALVERFFLTLNLMLHNKLPGGTFPLQKLREWDLDPQKFAVLTLEQAEGLLDLAIGTYHQSLHRSLKDTPVRTWLRGVNADTGINILGDDSQLDKLLGAREERLVTRSGVELFNLRYHDPAITGPLLEDLARREAVRGRREGSASAKVAVKYNPANLGKIHVWNGPRGVYVTLPCTDREYAEGLSKWQHDRLQEWQRESNARTEDDRRALRLRLRSAIGALEDPKILRRQKRAQARLLASPKIEALGGGGLRIAHAEPRPDGMAPVIPTVALAAERTDDSAKPVRPQRGGRRKIPRPPTIPTPNEQPEWNVADLADQSEWKDVL